MNEYIAEQRAIIAKKILQFCWPMIIMIFSCVMIIERYREGILVPFWPTLIIFATGFLTLPVCIKKKYEFAMGMLVITLIASIASGMIFNGGVYAPIYHFGLAVVILIQVFYGLRGALVFAALLTIFAIFIVVFHGQLNLIHEYSPERQIICNLIVMTAVITFSYIPLRLMNNALLESRAHQKKLKELHSSVQYMIDMMPAFMAEVHKDGKITQWNSYAEKLTGVQKEDALRSNIKDVLPFFEMVKKDFDDVFEDKSSIHDPALVVGRDDGKRTYDMLLYAIDPDTAVLKLEDVSDKARMQEMLILTEKMISVGGLAAGVAHEINNPLGIIIQSIYTSQQRLSKDFESSRKVAERKGLNYDALIEFLEERKIFVYFRNITEAIERSSNIIQNMLNFSSTSVSFDQRYNVREIIQDAVRLSKSDYELKKKYDFDNIDLQVDCPANLPELRMHRNEIIQVLLNLFRNSAQAMSEIKDIHYRPSISISCYIEKQFIDISVKDNGPGIDGDKINKIFDPFFTTKEPGVGTGLGLSVSYFIVVNKHKGRLKAFSEYGKGAEFIVQLPIVSNRRVK